MLTCCLPCSGLPLACVAADCASLFVGDLAPDVSDIILQEYFRHASAARLLARASWSAPCCRRLRACCSCIMIAVPWQVQLLLWHRSAAQQHAWLPGKPTTIMLSRCVCHVCLQAVLSQRAQRQGHHRRGYRQEQGLRLCALHVRPGLAACLPAGLRCVWGCGQRTSCGHMHQAAACTAVINPHMSATHLACTGWRMSGTRR